MDLASTRTLRYYWPLGGNIRLLEATMNWFQQLYTLNLSDESLEITPISNWWEDKSHEKNIYL